MLMAEEKKNNTGLIAGIVGGVVAVVAIVVVVIVIIANSGPSIVGKWGISSMKDGDREVSLDAIKSAGMDNTMEFKDDGTCTLTSAEGTQNCTYDKSKKTINNDGETGTYEFKDGKLHIKTDDLTMIYEKK
jgi:hypothetical protein